VLERSAGISALFNQCPFAYRKKSFPGATDRSIAVRSMECAADGGGGGGGSAGAAFAVAAGRSLRHAAERSERKRRRPRDEMDFLSTIRETLVHLRQRKLLTK
jgi:hypothetical protein